VVVVHPTSKPTPNELVDFRRIVTACLEVTVFFRLSIGRRDWRSSAHDYARVSFAQNPNAMMPALALAQGGYSLQVVLNLFQRVVLMCFDSSLERHRCAFAITRSTG
jgi:hypothetical protein